MIITGTLRLAPELYAFAPSYIVQYHDKKCAAKTILTLL